MRYTIVGSSAIIHKAQRYNVFTSRRTNVGFSRINPAKNSSSKRMRIFLGIVIVSNGVFVN